MIPEFISPSITSVALLGLAFWIAGLSVIKFARVPMNPLRWFILAGAALAATGLSLLYSYTFRGGDYFWLRRGYPHYFWSMGDVAGFPDVALNNALQGFDPGPLGVYVSGNLFFYLSLFLCGYAVLFALRNRMRAVR